MQRVRGPRPSDFYYRSGPSRDPSFISRYVFQEELGGEEWTPHLQGVIHNKTQVALATLKSWNPRIHWESSRSIYNSVKYCSDPEKRAPQGRIWSSGFNLPSQEEDDTLKPENFYAWQTALHAELQEKPDPRRITWYYDGKGGSGKTAFCKWAVQKFPSTHFFSGGKFTDISYQIIKSTSAPRLVIINLPRTSEGKISYGALEAIKDGLISSGKYEGGFRSFPPPHVVVMANFRPDENALSLDRWDIRSLHMNVLEE